MSVVVFCGPSLSFARAAELLPGCLARGPAACGDVYRAARNAPDAIVLIDGYFDHRLSVWHKEVLWALERGVPVYGGASMGALRAAELHAFGMVGVGWIFEQFANGELEDDDEVAVVHHAEERGYAPMSEAMVNLRATLRIACDERVVERADVQRLTAALKGVFYAHRSRAALLELAREVLSDPAFERFAAWLERAGMTNQKGQDAEQLLRRVGDDAAAGFPRLTSRVRLEVTDAWEALRARLDRDEPVEGHIEGATSEGSAAPPEGAPACEEGHVRALDDPLRSEGGRDALRAGLESLRHTDPALFSHVMYTAAQRAMALSLSRQARRSVDAPLMQDVSESFRRERGLLTPEQTHAWLLENHLDVATFSALIHDAALVLQSEADVTAAIDRELPGTLRALGLVARVLEAG